MKAYERVAEFDTKTNKHRVFDIDKFGREVSKPMDWKPTKTKGNTNLSHAELWEEGCMLVANYRPDSRTIHNGIIQLRRYL